VDLEKTKPRLRNANVAVRESGGEIVFLHRIVPGGADQSYGIHVARLAGVPLPVLERAREILAFLEKQHGPDPGPPAGPIRKVKTGRALQNSLFSALPDPLLVSLRQVDLRRSATTKPSRSSSSSRSYRASLGNHLGNAGDPTVRPHEKDCDWGARVKAERGPVPVVAPDHASLLTRAPRDGSLAGKPRC